MVPLFDVQKLSADVEVSAFSEPKLAFGIELIDVGNIDVALVMKLPEISATLSAEYGMFHLPCIPTYLLNPQLHSGCRALSSL